MQFVFFFHLLRGIVIKWLHICDHSVQRYAERKTHLTCLFSKAHTRPFLLAQDSQAFHFSSCEV